MGKEYKGVQRSRRALAKDQLEVPAKCVHVSGKIILH
jgi:hypothetical protein